LDAGAHLIEVGLRTPVCDEFEERVINEIRRYTACYLSDQFIYFLLQDGDQILAGALSSTKIVTPRLGINSGIVSDGLFAGYVVTGRARNTEACFVLARAAGDYGTEDSRLSEWLAKNEIPDYSIQAITLPAKINRQLWDKGLAFIKDHQDEIQRGFVPVPL
jgi:hypothetical protein